ncbi:hypothetical protein ACFSO7_21215 [Bacillus sp. CGMCC 1.16607]|uniref:hypothetical protein n=1 Tax=Bacillus sp. CGMCC 1.16607 TaxID=3351842 RepID=UPI003639EC04
MEPEKVERQLQELKKQIPVDQVLKKKLRGEFLNKGKSSYLKNPWISGLLAAVIFIAFFMTSIQTQQVNASSLNISNSISFFDIGSGEITAYTHHNDELYIAIKNKGLYRYNDQGMKKISEISVDGLSHSLVGETLIYTNNGDLFNYDLKLNKSGKISKEGSKAKYSFPTWINSNEILVTKKNGNEQKIVQINIETLEEKDLTIGNQPSYSEKQHTFVFSRNGNVMIKNLKNGKEKLVDVGRDPFMSIDGSYITYIKDVNGFEDVWIADFDLKTKKKVTTNIPMSVENSKEGLYQYFSPIWGTDERTLYMLKKRKQQEGDTFQLMKISLSEKELTAKTTVERYLQALIVRDDDYAKSIMEHPPEFLTYSNPNRIGYKIISSKEKTDSVSVTADVYWTETAIPYYKISTYEFILVKKTGKYMIQKVTELANKEIIGLDETELVSTKIKILEDGVEETLFQFRDIPSVYKRTENIRISHLVMDPNEKFIIFSLQEMEEKQGSSKATILKYDLKKKHFSLIADIEPENGHDAYISRLSLDSTGRYLAVDFSVDQQSLFIFDSVTGKKIDKFHKTNSIFWQNDKLLIREVENFQFMMYQYNPKTQIKKTF